MRPPPATPSARADGDPRAGAAGADAAAGPGSRPTIGVVSLPGRVPYREALELQRGLARARIDGERSGDLLLLLEHDPVLTLGRGTDEGHLRAGRDELEARGIDVVEVERGGDVTYHGPGQLVGYPILDLRDHRKDLHWYLRAVEEALIRGLGDLGVPAFRVPGHTGVWVGRRAALEGGGDRPPRDGTAPDAGDDGAVPAGPTAAGAPSDADPDNPSDRPVEAPEAPDAPSAGPDGSVHASGDEGDAVAAAILEGRVRKIASIGVHVSRWVTWHGFALNVTGEALESFGLIVPCGIRGVRMTSLEGEGVAAGGARVREAVAAGFASAFDARVEQREGVPSP